MIHKTKILPEIDLMISKIIIFWKWLPRGFQYFSFLHEKTVSPKIVLTKIWFKTVYYFARVYTGSGTSRCHISNDDQIQMRKCIPILMLPLDFLGKRVFFIILVNNFWIFGLYDVRYQQGFLPVRLRRYIYIYIFPWKF